RRSARCAPGNWACRPTRPPAMPRAPRPPPPCSPTCPPTPRTVRWRVADSLGRIVPVPTSREAFALVRGGPAVDAGPVGQQGRDRGVVMARFAQQLDGVLAQPG